MPFRPYVLPIVLAWLWLGAHTGALAQAPSPAGGIEATHDGTRLRVQFVTDRIVHVTATRNAGWSSRVSMMRQAVTEKPGLVTVDDTGSRLTLQSAALSVTLERASGALTMRDRAGRVLLQEDPAAPRSFVRTDVMKSVPDPATMHAVQTADGERQVATADHAVRDRQAWTAQARFVLDKDEALYGLGFDESSDLNLRGTSKRLYQHNLRVVVPFMVSTRGYGLLFDTYSAMTFTDGPQGMSVGSDVVDDLDYYFVLGPDMDGAVAGYRQLTGAASMLPRWAYGYIQSKERYTTQQEVVDTVRQFRERQIPLDVIVQDWNYWTPGHWGSMVPDPARYPDIGAMTAAVHGMHANTMISIWPNPSPLDAPGQNLKAKGFMSGSSAYVDFFRHDAADYYYDQVWHYLGRHGIDAWWTDSTEPEVSDWTWDAVRAPSHDQKNIDGLAKVIDPEWLNGYALADSQAMARFGRRYAPDKRLLGLTRSGYAGSQATGAVVWTGDISAKWTTLAQQVVAMQRFSASGTPYVTTDVGGFFVKRGKSWFWNGDYNGGVDDLGYRELYTRWLQFGAFLPLFRSHGTDTPREPWQFGAPGTPFYDAILSAIHLRYRLLPFLYSEAGHAYHDGRSLIRPVAFGFPEDRRTHDLKSQMLFGQNILVSPVLAPMYYGVDSVPLETPSKQVAVYLPAGTWYDFWTGKAYPGGATVAAEAPIERIPVHVRAGTVLPLGPARQYASEPVDAAIEVRVYPGADGHYTLYDDAGEGSGYQHGEHARIAMDWNDADRTLTIAARQGHFGGMARRVKFKLVVVGLAAGHGLDDSPACARAVVYSGTRLRIRAKGSCI